MAATRSRTKKSNNANGAGGSGGANAQNNGAGGSGGANAQSNGALNGTNQNAALNGTNQNAALNGTNQNAALNGTNQNAAVNGTNQNAALNGTNQNTAVNGTNQTTAVNGTAHQTTAVNGTAVSGTGTVNGGGAGGMTPAMFQQMMQMFMASTQGGGGQAQGGNPVMLNNTGHGGPLGVNALNGGAGTNAGPPPMVMNPRQELDTALRQCGVHLDAARARLITSQGISGLKDIGFLSEKDVKALIDSFNLLCTGNLKGQAIGFMTVKNICALAYAVGKCRRLNEPFDVSAWDDDAMERARDEMSNAPSTDSSTEPTKLPKPEDKTIDQDYEKWRGQCNTVFSQIRSAYGNGLSLYYVVMPLPVAGTTLTSEFDKLHAHAKTDGPNYGIDVRKVWGYLKIATNGTKLWSFIEKFDRAADGRRAFFELDRIFLGDDFIQKRLNSCFLIINLGTTSSVMYSDERVFTFTAYAGILVENFAYIEKYRGAQAQESQVQRLVGGITGDAKQRLAYAIEQVKDHHAKSMESAITYLSGKVNDAYAEFNLKGKNQRSVKETRRGGPGRGGGGRGGGRGGRGRGNGALGQTEIKTIDGHDTSDTRLQNYRFPQHLMKGFLGSYVMKRRRYLEAQKASGDKRKVQELTTANQKLAAEVKKYKAAAESTEPEEAPSSEKGGQAGATFGKNGRKKP